MRLIAGINIETKKLMPWDFLGTRVIGPFFIVNGLQLEISPCRDTALLLRVFFMGLLVRFSLARSYIFNELAFCFNGRAREFHGLTHKWKTMGSHRKTNQPNWPHPPFHSIFQPRQAPTIPNQSPFTMIVIFLNLRFNKNFFQ